LITNDALTTPGVAKSLVTVAIEPGSGTTDEEVEEWYKTDVSDTKVHSPSPLLISLRQHLNIISKLPGYQRSTYYKLLYARTNAQSRALKGLPTTDAAPPEPPTLQVIHEFDRVVKLDELKEMKETAKAKKILEHAKQLEIVIFTWRKSHGDKKFFD
jgi:hypothetical protein